MIQPDGHGALPVRHEEDAFTTPDGLRLLERRWMPHGKARAHVVVVHGYAEHSGRYAHAAERLARHGYGVHALDLRGHGRSDGPVALVRSFGEFLGDVRLFMRRIGERHAGETTFILGHSMGGAIAALYTIVDRPRVAGLVLSGPALGAARNPGIVTRAMLLAGRIAPRLPTVRLDASAVSRDPGVVLRYRNDPLVYTGRVRAGFVAAMIRAARHIDERVHHVSLPLLIMHGTEDKLASHRHSREFHDRAASSDKTLRLYDGLYHEIFNEPERDEVLADMIAWLDERSA